MEKSGEFEIVNEYNFEDGAEEAVKRIKKIFESSEGDIIVEINGSGVHVGKTHLLRALTGKLHAEGIESSFLNERSRSELKEIRTMDDMARGANRRVYIIGTGFGMYSNLGTEHYRNLQRNSEDGLAADLYIGIYRPDKPFSENPVADMIIRNEHARDKENNNN